MTGGLFMARIWIFFIATVLLITNTVTSSAGTAVTEPLPEVIRDGNKVWAGARFF